MFLFAFELRSAHLHSRAIAIVNESRESTFTEIINGVFRRRLRAARATCLTAPE